MSAKNELDQYYTNPVYAKECYEKVLNYIQDYDDYDFMEPCVGTGSFYNNFPVGKRFGFDLEPKIEDGDNIVTTDFLVPNLILDYARDNPIAVVSNPPFGKNCSLAVEFFNQCAEHNDVKYIAFVIPKTFKKSSIQSKLNSSFRLVLDEDTPKKAFILHGEEYDVPCVFQIWERYEEEFCPGIVSAPKTKTHLFSRTTKDDANLCIQRVGSRAGELRTKEENMSTDTMYYLWTDYEKEMLDVLSNEEYLSEVKTIRDHTAGVRSISLPELISLVEKYIVLQ